MASGSTPFQTAWSGGNGSDDQEKGEEDYMSMTITEPPRPRGEKETYSQKKLRKQRESEAKSQVPSKAEVAAAEAARRDAVLSTSALDPSNKGFRMMTQLGFKPGDALGRPLSPKRDASAEEWNYRRTEPLNIIVKEDRGGIGMDNDKKRKFRIEAELKAKRVKEEERDFRQRVRLEREEKRAERLFYAGQKVAERLDAEAEVEVEVKTKYTEDQMLPRKGSEGRIPYAANRGGHSQQSHGDDPASSSPPRPASKTSLRTKPTSQINILYRGLVRSRDESLRRLRVRRGLYQFLPSHTFFPSPNLPKLPGYSDSILDVNEKFALDANTEGEILEGKVDGELEDEELEVFNALGPHERLRRLVAYLREKHRYCLWCKCRYETAEMDGCPGMTEEDHD